MGKSFAYRSAGDFIELLAGGTHKSVPASIATLFYILLEPGEN